MPRFLLLFFCIQFYSPTSSAQWKLHAEHSADYECLLGTVEEGVKRGQLNVEYIIQDTLLFDVRRTIKPASGGWTIGYQVLKTYPFGLFRTEKATYRPTFSVDQQGKQKNYAPPKTKLNRAEQRINEYFKTTLIPYPSAALQFGKIWKESINGEQWEFAVQEGLQKKIARSCFQVGFKSTTTQRQGTLFLEEKTGQLVYLEWTDNKSPCAGCYGNKYHLQLSLRAPDGLIAEKMAAFAKGDSTINRLRQSYAWVVPMVYNEIKSMSNEMDQRGYVVQLNGYFGWLNETGKTILQPVHEQIQRGGGQMMQAARKNNFVLMDSTGRVLIDSLDEITLGATRGQTSQVVRKKGEWMEINAQGKVLNTYSKNTYSNFSDPTSSGKIWALNGSNSGLVQGERIIIPVEYPYFRRLGNGIISAHKDSTAYLFDWDGNVLWSRKGGPVFAKLDDIVSIGGEGLFNWKTQELIYPSKGVPIYFEQIDPRFFSTNDPDSYGKLLFDPTGRLLGNFKMLFGLDGDLLMAADTLGRHGIVNFKGEWVVQPQYKWIQGLKDGVFIAEIQPDITTSLFGLLRTNGEIILPFEYHSIQLLDSGIYYVERLKRVQDPVSKLLVYPSVLFRLADRTFIDFPPNVLFEHSLTYDEDVYLKVKKEGKTGLLDLNLAEIVPIEFKQVGPITRYGVIVETGGKAGAIKRK